MLHPCGKQGKIVPLTDKVRAYVLRKADELNGGGMRVIAVAQKTNPAPEGQFSTADEKDMVLIGFLAFLDPPKKRPVTRFTPCGNTASV